MSKRKKRMIVMVSGVLICAIAVWYIVMYIQKKDAREFARRCRSYVGVWTSDDGQYEMTVRRVTGAHMILTLNNRETETELASAIAHAVTENRYEFTYKLEQNIYTGENTAWSGGDNGGSLELLDSSIRLEVPGVRARYPALDFKGVFKNKKALKEEKIRLLDNMGTENAVPENMKDCCVFEKGKEGRIERLHIFWEKAGERLFHSEINGINKLCFAGDCESVFGRAAEEEALDNDRRKLVFYDDTYRYDFIVNNEDLVVEGECQYREMQGRIREGDFLLEGDTIVRYLGDYEKNRDVTLPEGAKRIATHAFTEEILNDPYLIHFKLRIPAGVEVEKEAFAGCSKMTVFLDEGWSEVPERAFANMVVNQDVQSLKWSWVNVTLPKSMRKLGKGAFEQDGIRAEDLVVEDDSGEIDLRFPISVWLNQGLEVIEEDALSGFILRDYLPDSVKKVGRGITLLASEVLEQEELQFPLPSKLEEIGDDAFHIIDGEFINRIRLPDSLRLMGENAFTGLYRSDSYFVLDNFDISVGKNNPYFKKDKSEQYIMSKDGKVLYRTLDLSAKDSYLEFGEHIKIKREAYEKGKFVVRAEFTIPEGVEEVRSDALEDIHNLFEYYYLEDYESDTLDITITYRMPKSLKRISRRALFMAHQQKKIQGDIPEFSGEIDEERDYFKGDIYVKKGQKKAFLESVFAGQEHLSEKTKQLIRSHVKTY